MPCRAFSCDLPSRALPDDRDGFHPDCHPDRDTLPPPVPRCPVCRVEIGAAPHTFGCDEAVRQDQELHPPRQCGLCLRCWPLPRGNGTACHDPGCSCHGGEWVRHPEGGQVRAGSTEFDGTPAAHPMPSTAELDAGFLGALGMTLDDVHPSHRTTSAPQACRCVVPRGGRHADDCPNARR